jgi:cytochrome P450
MRQATPQGSRPGSIAHRKYADLPGPKGIPFLGNALQFDNERSHLQLEALSHRFGPSFRMRIGSRRVLVISDHDIIGSVLRDRPDGFRRPTRHGEIVREMGLEQGVFFVNGDTWKQQRRMVMSALDPKRIKAFFPSLLTVVQRLRGRWQKAATARLPIDLQADLMRYTVDAVAGLAFGSDVNTLGSDEDVIQRHLNLIFPAISRRVAAAVPYWRYFKLPADHQLDCSVRAVREAIEAFIAGARQRMNDDAESRTNPRNLLEAMIAAAEQAGGETTDRDIAGNVLVMLLAGEDTTANTLAWMIDLLCRNPVAMRHAQEEVLRVAPDLSAFTLEQIASLEYVEACIHETMRLKPVTPILSAQANRDIVIGDIEVPADTFVLGVMRRDAMDERYFPRAAKFEPERWVYHGTKSPGNATARVMMPFGAGPRLCPGRYLALLEIKMAVAMLLGNFSIERVGTDDGKPAQEFFAFTMGPVGLRMKLAMKPLQPSHGKSAIVRSIGASLTP